MVNPYVFFYALGIYPVLVLSSEEVQALNHQDVAMLRESGATAAMLDTLRELAGVPGRALRVDFAQQTITIDTM